MAEKEQENAIARAQEAEESEEEEEDEDEIVPSDRESEEGVDRAEDDPKPISQPSPKVKKTKTVAKSPKKKKVTSAGMQIPEHWPWEEAKKLFLQPDVVKCDDMEVSPSLRTQILYSSLSR